jgi:hypothetical protein
MHNLKRFEDFIQRVYEWFTKHDVPVENIYEGMKNGTILIRALEQATGKIIKHNKKAIMRVHCMDNISVALMFLQKGGIDTSNISPQEIYEGTRSKILGLLSKVMKVY